MTNSLSFLDDLLDVNNSTHEKQLLEQFGKIPSYREVQDWQKT